MGIRETQITDTVLMIRPDTFQFNYQTAHTNLFQQEVVDHDATEKALKEFEEMVAVLQSHDIRVMVLRSRNDVITPDAVFPNNWFTTHSGEEGSTVILYPMLAENRRMERQRDALKQALATHHIQVADFIDLSHYEKENKFLEGTGSVILDRVNHLAYAALSPRTNLDVLRDFATRMHYTPIIFHSYDKLGVLIYHTNVMMSVGSKFVVIAADSIIDPDERASVFAAFKQTAKEVINISLTQMENMAANILEVRSISGKPKIIMSKTAFAAFTPEQHQILQHHGEIVAVDIATIEKLGGGSARCMLAEIFSRVA